MDKWLCIDKLQRLRTIIKQNRGLKGMFLQLLRRDMAKFGTLVGVDELGNRYYENNYYFFGTNRWVEYNEKFGWDYDGSQVSAEWFGWLHYKTDLPPFKDPNKLKYKWMEPHTPNFSGTPLQYVPYSTTKPKITAWQPPKN